MTIIWPLQSVGRTISARAWAYVGRDPAIMVYDFTTDKSGQHIRNFLKSWSSTYLQADAARNYDELYRQRPKIREVGCWAHARRKFIKIAALADKNGQRVLAHEAVERIGGLFAVERLASEAGDSPPERGKRRQRDARPFSNPCASGVRKSCGNYCLSRRPRQRSPTCSATGPR